MSAMPDWHDVEEMLFGHAIAGVSQFLAEHPHEVCSFVAYDVNPHYGEIYLCFDTLENSLRQAKLNEQEAVETRTRMLGFDWSWQNAQYYTTQIKVTDYSPNVGAFSYHMFAEAQFPEWRELAYREDYPQANKGWDDYIEGNVRIVLSRLIDRLCDTGGFESLQLASPCRVGYQFHDGDLLVMRILNWPEARP